MIIQDRFDEILRHGRETLVQEANALFLLSDTLKTHFVQCVELLLHIKGRTCVTGMGKSGHVARKIAATLSSTGTPAFFMHPSEASHGDLGMMTPRDALIAISNSGNTSELGNILLFARNNSIPIIAITSNISSPLVKYTDYYLILPHIHEACPLDCAPTTSTTMSLALGDALAMALMEARGFTSEDFKTFHPGGSLGKRLLRVQDAMHIGDEVPLCDSNDFMSSVIVEMNKKMLGCVGITENGSLVGIITDGDIRRNMSNDLLEKKAFEIMTKHPQVIDANKTLDEAQKTMHSKRITSIFSYDTSGNIGIIHIHDIDQG